MALDVITNMCLLRLRTTDYFFFAGLFLLLILFVIYLFRKELRPVWDNIRSKFKKSSVQKAGSDTSPRYHIRPFDWLDIPRTETSGEQTFIDVINRSKNEQLPLNQFMPFGAIFLEDREFFGNVMQEDVLLIGGFYKGGKTIGFQDVFAFYPKTHRVRKRFDGIGGINCFTRWGSRVAIGFQDGYVIWEPPETGEAMMKWSGCTVHQKPDPIVSIAPINGEQLLLGSENNILVYSHEKKKDMMTAFMPKTTGVAMNETHIVVTRDERKIPGGYPAAICFENAHPLNAQMTDYEANYSKNQYDTGATDSIRAVNRLLTEHCSYAQDVKIWEQFAIVVNMNSTIAVDLQRPEKYFIFDQGGIAIAQNPKRPEEFWIGTAGGGVAIIQYHTLSGQWAENREAIIMINNELRLLTGTERIYVSCICFLKDDVFIGTERQGLYLITQTSK